MNPISVASFFIQSMVYSKKFDFSNVNHSLTTIINFMKVENIKTIIKMSNKSDFYTSFDGLIELIQVNYKFTITILFLSMRINQKLICFYNFRIRLVIINSWSLSYSGNYSKTISNTWLIISAQFTASKF